MIRLSSVLMYNFWLVPESLVMLGGCCGNQSCDALSVSLQSYLFFPTSREGSEAEAELILALHANVMKPLQPFKETGSEKLLDFQQLVPGGCCTQRGREAPTRDAHRHPLMMSCTANKYMWVLL